MLLFRIALKVKCLCEELVKKRYSSEYRAAFTRGIGWFNMICVAKLKWALNGLGLSPLLHNNAILTPLKYHVFENIMENGALMKTL